MQDKTKINEDDILFFKSDEDVNNRLLRHDQYDQTTKTILDKSQKRIFAEKQSAFGDKLGRKIKGSPLSLDKLKKRFGFSWKKFGIKLVFFTSLILIFGLVTASAVSTFAIDAWNSAPSADDILANPDQSSVILAADGKTELYKFFDEEKREIVDSQNIPEVMKMATIALEDENFYENEGGVPWSNIAGATIDCGRIIALGTNENCRGGSGVSQQLVKNLTGESQTTINRKIKELFTSIKLNEEKTPDEILNLYLNTVPFGRNAYGVQEASVSYFGKDIYERNSQGEFTLNPAEACYLASFVQQTSYFSSGLEGNDPERVEARNQFISRKNFCLEKLSTVDLKADGGLPYLDPEDAEFWKEVKLEIVSKDANKRKPDEKRVTFVPRVQNIKYPHFVDYVIKELVDKKILGQTEIETEQQLYKGGFEIITSIDPSIQNTVEKIFRDNQKEFVTNYGANNAASVVLEGKTGRIVAMVGSLDYYNKKIDGQVNITTSAQQPGSSIKPYVYASAFERGYNPGTVMLDRKMDFGGGFSPNNISNTTSGAVTIRSSLQNSLNIPAVQAVFLSSDKGKFPDAESGVRNFLNFTRKTGVSFPCIPGASNSLFKNGIEKCDGSDNVDPEDAYRGRCFLAAAIGGCEINMVTHTTGLNTFAQDGTLRTATPFKNIYQKGGDGNYILDQETGEKLDIYKIVQESENPAYPNVAKKIDPLIARQVNNVLSDERSRNFGSLNNNLVVPGWQVASKTGTSNQGSTNAAVDAWTVGYTPIYTTSVWVGNTDNSPIIRGGIYAAAPIWKKIMIELHKGKDPAKAQFTTNGLTPIRLSPATGYYSPGGRLEYLTEDQINLLNQGGSLSGKPNFDPFKYSVFDTRSPVVFRKVKVNEVDNKLAVEGLTPSYLVKEVECYEYISFFPSAANWYNPAKSLNKIARNGCPTEKSDYDGSNAKVSINTNLENQISSPEIVNISVNPSTGSGVKVVLIEFYIDGVLIQSVENKNSLAVDVSAISALGAQVRVFARDSVGIEAEINYTDVNFDF